METERTPHMQAAMVAVEILHGDEEWPPEFRNLATQYLELVRDLRLHSAWPEVLRDAMAKQVG